MNNPFFGSYFNPQSSHQSRQFPVQQTQRQSSPKVVSVPVHFVSSEQPPTTALRLKESAAIKIQRVFRGFLVRKSVKKIVSIRNEVCEIERRINDVNVVELIRSDAKERLRVNETLMSLLFKLDSVRGVDSGVRDFRKAVTKKAIALQEKVDSIVVSDRQSLDSVNDDSFKSTPEQVIVPSDLPDETVCDVVKSAIEHVEADHRTQDSANNDHDKSTSEQVTSASDHHNEIVDDSVKSALEQVPDNFNHHDLKADNSVKNAEDGPDFHNQIVDSLGNLESAEDSVANVDEDGGVVKEVVKEIDENCKLVKGVDDDNQKNRELLEKLMEDNEKMMKLMTQIFERNEMQTRMLKSLSQRVEHLEKAFICDKLRKKKKRHPA